MDKITLKVLYTYLKILENPAELKRKMPTTFTQRILKEGLFEMSRLLGIEPALFQDPQNLAAMLGPQRFVMICGEPSVGGYVARIFESSRVLWTVLVDPGHFERPALAQPGSHSLSAQHAAPKSFSATWSQSNVKSSDARAHPNSPQENALQNLIPILAGNMALSCRLFRVIFEHMLGFASHSSMQLDSPALVNELTGTKEHGRSMLSTILFLMGLEMDRENLVAFLLEQHLFGMQIFEHLLQNRDYCAAYYSFRHLERAFVGTPSEEEQQLSSRMSAFNAQFGGEPSATKIIDVDDPDKGKIDAHLAALDLIEAMTLTPFSICLTQSIAAEPSNCVRSMKTIARHFERFAGKQLTKEQTNQEITEHLLAFARQFSGDTEATS